MKQRGVVDLACLKREGKSIVIEVKQGYEIPDLSFIKDIEIYEDDEQDYLAYREKTDKRFTPI